MSTQALLRVALSAAVPLWVADLQRRPWVEVQELARACADTVASKGDVILYRSKKKGETAEAFNALAKGIAALSFAPGGVTFLGDHYENKHESTGTP